VVGIPGLFHQVPGDGDRVADPADVAVRGDQPLVVMGVVVDLERA
jgi:hypothetical protein